MNQLRIFSVFLGAALGTGAVILAACDTETATSIVVDNGYPAVPDGGDPAKQTVVYRAWWVATFFNEPVPGGASSSEQRGVPEADVAYAVLAPSWDPASTTPPATLVVVKSKVPLSVARGETLHIAVSDQAFTGNCAVGQPLSQADADFITQSIFPGEFANVTYDAKTCVTTALPSDEAGADAGEEGGGESGAEGGADAGPG